MEAIQDWLNRSMSELSFKHVPASGISEGFQWNFWIVITVNTIKGESESYSIFLIQLMQNFSELIWGKKKQKNFLAE